MSLLTAYTKFIQVALKYGFSLFGIPKTGQTTVYETNDDGTYQKGYPKTLARFTDNNDGTITDNATGLMWIKDPSELGGVWGTPALPSGMTWYNAIINCEALDYAGHADWRLPNIKELQSIADYSQYNPTINQTYFPNTKSSLYNSSTTYKNVTTQSWGVTFLDGVTINVLKISSYYVRPVRAG